MTIAANVIKEKIRRKDLYIISVVSIILTILFSTSNSTISINGVYVTEFSALFPIMLTAVSVFGCILAIVLGLSTIPNEYRRSTSHLIWTRGVSQPRYHGELALGNIVSSLIGLAILFVGLALLCIIKGEWLTILRLPVAYLFSAIPVCITSLCVGATSIKLSPIATGFISASVVCAGFLRGILITLINVISSSFISNILRRMLEIIPDMFTIQLKGSGFVTGNTGNINVHAILGGVLIFYLLTLPVLFLRKKEA